MLGAPIGVRTLRRITFEITDAFKVCGRYR
jgi:hypothetical protein